LFARVEKLERLNRRWKALATVPGVFLLLLLWPELVYFAAFRVEAVVRQRLAVEQALEAEAQDREGEEAVEQQRRARPLAASVWPAT
jgi:hypothetical protein